MRKFKNVEWNVPTGEKGNILDWDAVRTSILMDIRDELQALNRVMQCQNVQRGFRAMERMDRRLAQEVKLKAGRKTR